MGLWSVLNFHYILGIQQWRLDSDSGTPGFNKKDEIYSFQNVPGIKVS